MGSIRARASEDWRDLDRILLSKVVRMEADIWAHQQTLDRSGVIIQNKRGTLVTNPLLAVVDIAGPTDRARPPALLFKCVRQHKPDEDKITIKQ